MKILAFVLAGGEGKNHSKKRRPVSLRRFPRLSATSDASSMPMHQYRMIAEAAYFKAAQRNFGGGRELDDWLEAEAEIARFLSKV